MIGWYVDVGVSDKSSLSNLSDITFLDFNRPLCFPTISSEYLDSQTYYRTKSEAQDALSASLGSDFSYLYYACYRYTTNSDEYSSFIPSSFLSFPNTLNYAKERVGDEIATGLVFFFKSFNTILYQYSFSSSNVTSVVYSVREDGTVFEIGSLRGNTGNGFKQYDKAGAILFIPDYNKEVPLKQQHTAVLSVVVNQSQTYYARISFSGLQPANDIASLLFNNANTPDIIGTIPPQNPYEPGGPSGPGDLPPGTFDDNSDPIPDSSLPTISSANTGFTRIYNPSLSQVQALASYLWTTPDVIETIWNHIKQFFENPMEAMIGFNLVPVPVPNGGTTNFKLMYIDTGVQMTAAASQFVDRDCGTLKIERYYGSALDQSPYTKISCFLPYIGTVQLNTDEVMGTTLQVKYRVDICSGSCVAKIFVDGSCLYQYSGHCAIPIPFSAADFSSYVSAAVSVAKLAIGAATAGAAGAAAGAIPTAAQQTNQVITQATVSSPGSNLPALIPNRSQITEAPSDQGSTEASFSGISPTSISNTVGEIMTSKPHVEHSGSFSGNTGYLGIRRPYVIIERPNMCMPAQYQHFNGFPAMISMELGTCKGYTRIQQVQLTGMTATNPEQAEILELLKSGVVF